MTYGDNTPEALLHPGEMFGRYVVVRRLGRGGMGEVFEARHADLQKRVALKILRPDVGRNPKVAARFAREGVAIAKLEHPHVVDVYDVGFHEGMAFLVMEYLDGEDLGTVLQQQGRLSIDRAVDLMLPVLAAVGTAHEENIVHRDLKPANIFLARGRHGIIVPKVLDFGIARIIGQADPQNLTANSALLGTPYYIAPETTQGARHATHLSDQYSLGVILYQCMTGRRPFEGRTLYDTLHCIVSGQYVMPSMVNPEIPLALEAIIARALAFDPAQRYGSLFEMGAALLPFASSGVHAAWHPVFGHIVVEDQGFNDARTTPRFSWTPEQAQALQGIQPVQPMQPSWVHRPPPMDPSAQMPAMPHLGQAGPMGQFTPTPSGVELPAEPPSLVGAEVHRVRGRGRFAVVLGALMTVAVLAVASAWTLHRRELAEAHAVTAAPPRAPVTPPVLPVLPVVPVVQVAAPSIAPTPTVQAIAPTPAVQAIAPEPVAQPLAPTPVAQPLAPTPVAQPLAPEPVAQPLAPAPVAQPLAPTPVAPPHVAHVAHPPVTRPPAVHAPHVARPPVARPPVARPPVARPPAGHTRPHDDGFF